MDIVDVALRQHLCALGHPLADTRQIALRQHAIALGFDLAVADVHNGDLVHLDPPLAVLCIHAKHRRAILAHAKVILWQVARHGGLLYGLA